MPKQVVILLFGPVAYGKIKLAGLIVDDGIFKTLVGRFQVLPDESPTLSKARYSNIEKAELSYYWDDDNKVSSMDITSDCMKTTLTCPTL